MLKNFDYMCMGCGLEQRDVVMPQEQRTFPCFHCGQPMERTWLMGGSLHNVVGDECDVLVRNGLCNSDGSPRRYTSKIEMRKEAERRGLVQHVEHLGTKGGDRSKHTVRWT